MEQFYIGQIFENNYPSEASDFCNNSQGTENACHIEEIEPITRIIENSVTTDEEDINEEVIYRYQIVKNKPLTEDELKFERINELETLLKDTDWYAIRFADTGEPIPDDIKQQRKDAREEISRLRDI